MKPYYRILRLNHGRAPTVQHATLKEAETEALRLAGQHPGVTFEILKVIGTARTTTPSIFWNDEVEPPIEEPSYRMLEAGEQIEKGDEFRHFALGSGGKDRELAPWEPVLALSIGACLFRSNVGHYRRPLNQKP